MTFISRIQSRLYGWRWEKLNNRIFDWYYGTDTYRESLLREEGVSDPQAERGNSVYRPFWKTEFIKCIRSLGEDLAGYSFIDAGSGKGKILLLASRFPFSEIIGIEYAKGLHKIALDNIKKFKTRAGPRLNITSVNADATEWDMPDKPAIYFVYNSFDPDTTKKFFTRLDNHVALTNTPTFLIYGNLRDISEREDAFPLLRSMVVRSRTLRYIIFSSISATWLVLAEFGMLTRYFFDQFLIQN